MKVAGVDYLSKLLIQYRLARLRSFFFHRHALVV